MNEKSKKRYFLKNLGGFNEIYSLSPFKSRTTIWIFQYC